MIGVLAGLFFGECCASCGAKTVAPLCENCVEGCRRPPSRHPPEGVDAIWSAYLYEGPARDLVLEVKFGGRHRACAWMASQIPETEALLAGAERYEVVAVPDRRGADESLAGGLARAYARAHSLALRRGLAKTRRTADQASLGRQERFGAQDGSFGLVGPSPPIVILIDDIVTTGATLSACAKTLRNGGARRVEALTFASTGIDFGCR